jgi:anaerobic magnesium-protoporphyrin IX monomethyl ester cyclase
MSILLTHAYFLAEDEIEQKIMKPYPPLGLLYISAYLDLHKISHQVCDTTFLSEAEWFANIYKTKPKVIAFYTNLLTKVKILSLIKRLKKIEEFKYIQIVLGGPDVTYNEENYLKHGADFLVVGEGEETFLEFSQQFFGNRNFAEVDGLVYLSEIGEIIRNSPRKHIKDIDLLPLPNREKIDLSAYLIAWNKHHGQNALNISTQRGCPYSCRWCSKAVYGQSYRRRNPKLVVDEIELLIQKYNPDTLWFVDDVFTVNQKWVDDFSKEMKARGIKIPFECITRAEHLDEDTLLKLKSAGCFRIWIGAESGSQRILDLMDRRVKVEQVKEMVRLTRELGIETGTFIMVGYPGETENDIIETIQYLKQANPDLFTVTITYPIKGTLLYEQIKNKILIEPDWDFGTDREINFKRTYSLKYYDYAVRRMTNEVLYHKEKMNGNRFQKKAVIHFIKAKISAIQMKLAK